MKTTDELIEYRLPKSAPGWGRITYEELDAIVKRTQQDAFECGRSSGYCEGYKDGASACNASTSFVVADRLQSNNPAPP